MTAEDIAAYASLGTLVVVVATAIAAFVQLRHLRAANQLSVLNDFRLEYERIQARTFDALPTMLERLEYAEGRREIGGLRAPDWVQPVMPLMRLFETLGHYTTRNIVSSDLVCDLWSPVILRWWQDFSPLIAVWRRSTGPTLFENWEAIAVKAERWLAEERGSYPRGLARTELVDPWADVDLQAKESSPATNADSV